MIDGQREMTASEVASEGGKARAAALSPVERSEIARRAAEARWLSNAPRATHAGELQIAGRTFQCAVLEDGRRVLTQETFLTAIGRSRKGKGGQAFSSPDGLPPFVAADSLKPFVTEDLKRATVPIVYRTPSGNRAFGYEANLLPLVCEVYLRACEEKKTTSQQAHIVKACELLMRGLAQVGIIGLVDEATGFQDVRDRQALQAILDKYLRKEFAAWARAFPDDFYREIFRLRSWKWQGMKINRPQCVAQYTKDLVYARLAPGILRELEVRNPRGESGRRKAKHYEWLTEDIGHPALAQHLHAIIGLMRASDSWEQMMKMVNRAFPKRGDSLQLSLFTDHD
jgi:P63C domain